MTKQFDKNQFHHSVKLRVQFRDLDAFRHVNNATYLSYLEESRIGYLSTVFNTGKNNLNINIIVARIEIDYLFPLQLNDLVKVYMRCSKVGNKSMDIENVIVLVKDTQEIISARAITKLVYFDYREKESKAIPVKFRKKIEAFESKITN
ncbi:long-chain acyl-CoA thioesterase FadM [bacterium BMS3Abin04]|nr:long-chain acyl-CoA thioesterase FadM [bacterium BMS3Abin04]